MEHIKSIKSLQHLHIKKEKIKQIKKNGTKRLNLEGKHLITKG